MDLIKIILVVIWLIYLYYRTGILFKKIIKSKSNDLATTLLYGFITNFALFELINLPFILCFKQAVKIIYIIFLITNILLIILSYLIKYTEKKYNAIYDIKNIQKQKKNGVFYLLAILVMIFQICNSAFLFKEDADDSFYISWANEAKELESLYETDPSVGLEESTFDSKYKFNTWEIYGGFIARVFDINVSTLFHTVYPLIYIMLAYTSYYLVLKKLLKKENLGLALFILSILFLFTGVSTKFKAVFLLGRIYQGKAILVNIIMPLVIAKFLDYKNFTKEDYVFLTITYVAALAFTPMTISLLSLLYGLFLVIILLRKDYKEFKKTIWLMLPIIIISVMYIVFACIGNQNLEKVTNPNQFNQIEDVRSFLGEGKSIVILYFISIFILFMKGNTEQKNIGVILPIVTAILVFNPLLTDIYIKLVTSDTYWRLYWLVPIEVTITVASVIIYDGISKEKMKYIFSTFLIFLLVISGKYMYTKVRGFSEFQNFEKIPQYIIDETYYISENSEGKTKVVAPPEPWESCMMRQYSSEIILLHSRDSYALENEYRRNFKELYQSIYFGSEASYDVQKINTLKDQYEVGWIILPKNKTLEVNDNLKYAIEIENEKNYLLKVKNN